MVSTGRRRECADRADRVADTYVAFANREQGQKLPRNGNRLGRAARALLAFALADTSAEALVTVEIDLVCDTYDTDIAASRTLLASLMTGARFEQHSHEDMPAIARKANRIAEYDPDFAVQIYRTVFTSRVTDAAATSIGNSRIIAFTSDRRQDYEHARWQLSQYVPGALERDPELGIRLLTAALEGFSASEHSTDAIEISFEVAERTARFLADHSHIWARDPDDPPTPCQQCCKHDQGVQRSACECGTCRRYQARKLNNRKQSPSESLGAPVPRGRQEAGCADSSGRMPPHRILAHLGRFVRTPSTRSPPHTLW